MSEQSPIVAGGRRAGEPRCADCAFFRDVGFAGNGWCLHGDMCEPDVRPLVRGRELACRRRLGNSRFRPIGAPAGLDRVGIDYCPTPLVAAAAAPPAIDVAGDDILIAETTCWSDTVNIERHRTDEDHRQGQRDGGRTGTLVGPLAVPPLWPHG